MTDVVTTTPETLFNEDFPELESLSDEARILCVDRNTNTNLMEGYQAPLSLLKGDKGDKGDTGAKGDTGPQGPRGYQGETGDKGDKGDKGDPGEKGAKGDKGDPGQNGVNGADGAQGIQGNGIAGMTSSKSGKVTTVTFNYTYGGSDSFQVSDGADGSQGGGDVAGPNSSTADDIAVFDGATGKKIKDGGKKISALQDKLVSGTNIKTINNQSILGNGNLTVGGSYTAGTNISISSNTINCTLENKQAVKDGTAVSLVDTGEKYMWNNGLANANTKTFFLEGTTGTTNIEKAQEIYNWYNAGKGPIIIYNGKSYFFAGLYNSGPSIKFFSENRSVDEYVSYSGISIPGIILEVTGTTVQSITVSSFGFNANFLSTSVSYNTPFTPTNDGHPATKKYVDGKTTSVGSSAPNNPTEGMLWYDTTNDVLKAYDGSTWQSVGSGGGGGSYTAGNGIDITSDVISNTMYPSNAGSTGQVLKKTASGTEWADESGGGGGITNNTTGTTTSVTQIWAGTETEYGNLGSYSNSIIYFTY